MQRRQGNQIRWRLQLGHAGEGVEITRTPCAPDRVSGFNWATPVKAWRLPQEKVNVSPLMASIGPRR